jgi:hypothetical protein
MPLPLRPKAVNGGRQRARRFERRLLRRACELEALRGGRGGGRRPLAVAAALAASGFGFPLARRFAWR